MTKKNFPNKLSVQTAVLVLLSLIFFSASSFFHLLLIQKKRALQPHQPELSTLPPILAFTTIALGGFRAIITDILWLRLSFLQQQGQYFELIQLTDWMTKLEPHLPSIWGFHAWNLSYNVSVLFPDHKDRWRWVHHGLSLIRDQGLRFNPTEPKLYWELGWIFQHKIGENHDQAHLYYKRAWAEKVVLDGHWSLNPKAQQPKTWIHHFEKNFSMTQSKLEELEHQWGPFDWRLPEAHALYWAWVGREYAQDLEALALDRMIYQCFGKLFTSGTLRTDPTGALYERSPDWKYLYPTLRSFAYAISTYPDIEFVRIAYVNFIQNSLRLLATYNKMEEIRLLEKHAHKTSIEHNFKLPMELLNELKSAKAPKQPS